MKRVAIMSGIAIVIDGFIVIYDQFNKNIFNFAENPIISIGSSVMVTMLVIILYYSLVMIMLARQKEEKEERYIEVKVK